MNNLSFLEDEKEFNKRPILTTIKQEENTFNDITNLIDGDYLLLSKDFINQSKNRIVFPKPNELQIDIDSEDAYQTYLRRIVAFKAYYYNCSEIITPSKSGLPKRHITITVEGYRIKYKGIKTFSNLERVAWQAILGSDQQENFYQ